MYEKGGYEYQYTSVSSDGEPLSPFELPLFNFQICTCPVPPPFMGS